MLVKILGACALSLAVGVVPGDPKLNPHSPDASAESSQLATHGVLIPARTSMSFDAMVASSHAVVAAYVLHVETVDASPLPFTEYTVGVLERSHGDTPDVVTIRVPGSTTSTPAITVVGAPSFTPTDEVVLFLRSRGEGDVFYVHALEQGVYRVAVEGSDAADRTLSGRHSLPQEGVTEFLGRVAQRRAEIVATKGPRAVSTRPAATGEER